MFFVAALVLCWFICEWLPPAFNAAAGAATGAAQTGAIIAAAIGWAIFEGPATSGPSGGDETQPEPPDPIEEIAQILLTQVEEAATTPTTTKPDDDDDDERLPVWFGQRRIGPTFGSEQGRDPITSFVPGVAIPVFELPGHPGILIAEGNRRLAGYSLQGFTEAPVCRWFPRDVEEARAVATRLTEPPLSPQTSIPSPVIPVTVSQDDPTPTAPFQVTSTVSAGRPKTPCP